MSNYLPSYYSAFIAKSRYARWLNEEGRREDWPETVSRYVENIVADRVDPKTKNEIEQAILGLEVMPSMRGLMTAGEALFRDNTCLYNCAYTPVEKIEDFDKAMFILLCGTGVGFSVERQYVSKLPSLPESFVATDEVYVVEDSKEGWAKSLRKVMKSLYKGEIIQLDYSRVRPAGARLKTFGGRASGPAPLKDLFSFIRAIFVNAAGRKLTSIEAHDIMCKIGEVVVVGGVRRSAMISLSNLSDDRMRHAKSGNWWENAGHRALANNSVAYTDKPDMETFMREWLSLVESKSGERGIFSRPASINKVKENGRRDPNWEFGTNPCSEIILRPRQFCNLHL
jgi:ribonucleoside-triphosphate reductase (thioredoxin)